MGAVSGAVTCGIGDAATSTFANFYSRAAFQALSHGAFQGTLSAVQGGSFLQGFAAGALSSIAASAFGGGNFWQGAVTGLFVAGMNHLAHMEDEAFTKHKFDKEIDNTYESKADSEAPATDATLNNMRENVPTLKNWYNKSGKPQMEAKSKMTYASDGISEALTFIDDNMKTSHTTFFKSSFASYRTLAHNMLHELGHAFFNYTGQFNTLYKKYGQYSDKPNAFSEVYAFKFGNQYGGTPYLNNGWYQTNLAITK